MAKSLRRTLMAHAKRPPQLNITSSFVTKAQVQSSAPSVPGEATLSPGMEAARLQQQHQPSTNGTASNLTANISHLMPNAANQPKQPLSPLHSEASSVSELTYESNQHRTPQGKQVAAATGKETLRAPLLRAITSSSQRGRKSYGTMPSASKAVSSSWWPSSGSPNRTNSLSLSALRLSQLNSSSNQSPYSSGRRASQQDSASSSSTRKFSARAVSQMTWQQFHQKIMLMDRNGDGKIEFDEFFDGVCTEPRILQCFQLPDEQPSADYLSPVIGETPPAPRVALSAPSVL